MKEKTCDICGKVCTKRSAMLAHKRWAHGGGPPPAGVALGVARAGLAEKAHSYEALLGEVDAFADNLGDALLVGVRRALELEGVQRGGGELVALMGGEGMEALKKTAINLALAQSVVLREHFKARLKGAMASDLKSAAGGER